MNSNVHFPGGEAKEKQVALAKKFQKSDYSRKEKSCYSLRPSSDESCGKIELNEVFFFGEKNAGKLGLKGLWHDP